MTSLARILLYKLVLIIYACTVLIYTGTCMDCVVWQLWFRYLWPSLHLILKPILPSSDMDVSGKVAIVTGSARGLGKAYAEALLQRAAKVRTLKTESSLGWRSLKTPTCETPDFGGHVTPLTLQYLWPRPPGVWVGGPGCKPGHSGWS